MNEEKEKLGLPWGFDRWGHLQSNDERWMGEPLYEARDFTLRAVNSHHALVEALEELLEGFESVPRSLGYDITHTRKAKKALKEAKQ